MGTYSTLPCHGAEITSAYRELEVAYHELQVAQVHLRSVHARSMHDRKRDRVLLQQELSRLSDRVDAAMLSYRQSMDRYIAATTSLLNEGPTAPAPPARHLSPQSAPRFRTESRS